MIKLNIPRMRRIRREEPETRKTQIFDAAFKIASKLGLKGLSRENIAAMSQVSGTLVYRYFGSMDELRDDIIRAAFKRGEVSILAKSLTFEEFRKLNRNPALTETLCQYLRSK